MILCLWILIINHSSVLLPVTDLHVIKMMSFTWTYEWMCVWPGFPRISELLLSSKSWLDVANASSAGLDYFVIVDVWVTVISVVGGLGTETLMTVNKLKTALNTSHSKSKINSLLVILVRMPLCILTATEFRVVPYWNNLCYFYLNKQMHEMTVWMYADFF